MFCPKQGVGVGFFVCRFIGNKVFALESDVCDVYGSLDSCYFRDVHDGLTALTVMSTIFMAA